MAASAPGWPIRCHAVGDSVSVIDKDAASFRRLDQAFRGKTVLGIGFDRDILVAAGVERADALAAVTSGDNTNIITARVARSTFRVPRVVTRIYDPRRAEIYQRLGLTTVSPTTWGISRVVQLLCHRDMDVITPLGNGEVEVVEIEVPHPWVSRPVSMVTIPGEVIISAIYRRGRTFIPTLGTVFEEGDRAAVTVVASSRGRLENLLALG